MIHPNQLPNYRGELYNMKQNNLEDGKRNATTNYGRKNEKIFLRN